MKRRDFLKYSSAGAITPLLINGLPLNTFANTKMMASLCEEISDRILVLVFLNGANDGINNLIPTDQYDDYVLHRPNLRIEQNKLIELDSSLSVQDHVGLHPSLAQFKTLYDNAKLNIVQGVSYPTPDKSHFRSREIIASGVDGTFGTIAPDGWIGRFMNHRYPEYQGFPFSGNIDPLGIRIGGAPAHSFHIQKEHNVDINLSGQDPAGYFSLIASISGQPILNFPESDLGQKLQYITQVENNVNYYAERITNVFVQGNNTLTYPSTNLANQLKTVARLINGGCKTQVYLCNLGGWDNHNNQFEEGDSSIGKHANLLTQVAEAVKAFQDDLETMGQDHRVLTTLYSEFGRKVIENGSNGTDHGTLGPVYIIGSSVEPGVIGTNIDLNNQDNSGAPHPNQTQHDYRQIFGTLLQDWLAAPNEGMQSVGFDQMAKLPIVAANQIASPECYIQPVTIPTPAIRAKLFLEGLFDAENGSHIQRDVTELMESPLGHPFQIEPFKYFGSEAFEIELPYSFTDWILAELRDPDDISIVVSRTVGWVDQQGQVRNMGDQDRIQFENVLEGNYYLVLYSRHHLPIVSESPLAVQGSNFANFDTTETYVAKGTETMKLVGGKMVMLAGDLNNDGVINEADLTDWINNRALLGGFRKSDIDGNRVVNTADYNLMQQNNGSTGYFNE